VGDREGRDFQFPEPCFFNPEKGDSPQLSLAPLAPYRNAWDAIGDLPEPDEDLSPGGKWGDLLASIPEGNNYLWHTSRLGGMNLFGWRTRYWSFLLKLAKEKPSWTIQAQPGSAIGPFHWTSRRLSVREMCRFQTFPDDYEIIGGRTTAQRQLGNAVPSLLAEILGLEIRSQLIGRQSRKTTLKLLPPCRKPTPAPEVLMDVPEKYHKYLGDHAPHPGKGKGPKKSSDKEALSRVSQDESTQQEAI
jgi:DNA (cytosine-5)-methyltransferase 1